MPVMGWSEEIVGCKEGTRAVDARCSSAKSPSDAKYNHESHNMAAWLESSSMRIGSPHR